MSDFNTSADFGGKLGAIGHSGNMFSGGEEGGGPLSMSIGTGLNKASGQMVNEAVANSYAADIALGGLKHLTNAFTALDPFPSLGLLSGSLALGKGTGIFAAISSGNITFSSSKGRG